jgi:DNA-directed RNA polymerase subunit beta'
VEYFNLSSRFGQVFTAGIGAEAIRKILEKMDIPAEIERLKAELDAR